MLNSSKKIDLQMAKEFIGSIQEPGDKGYNTVIPFEGGERREYGSLPEGLEKMAERNGQGVNIALATGNEWYAIENNVLSNPFPKSDVAVFSSTRVPHFCLGITYRRGSRHETRRARKRAIELVERLPLPPTTMVNTGTSLQLYWLLQNGGDIFCDEFLQAEEAAAFEGAQWICGMADLVYRLVLDEAAKVGLELEPLNVTIDQAKQYGFMGLYTLLPGFVHSVCNPLTGELEKYAVRVIKDNPVDYSFKDFEQWMDERIPGKPEQRMTYLQAVKALAEGEILYFSLLRSFPEAVKLDYRRCGPKMYINQRMRRVKLRAA